MSQGPLCPNLTQKVQKEVSQMANHNLSCVILLGGLSVNLNHLKMWLRGVYREPAFPLPFPFESVINQLVIPLFTIFSNPMNGNSSDHSEELPFI